MSPFKFRAFNAGPPACLGQNLATYEAMAVIGTLVRHYHFTFAPGWLEQVEKTVGIIDCPEVSGSMYGSSLTLPMKHPMMVKFRYCK